MISAFASIGINLLIYPSTLTHIFSGYRGQEAFENIQSESFVEKVSQYIPYINMELFGGLSKYIVLVVGILIVIIFVIRCVRINKSVDGEIVVHTSLNSDKVVTWKMYATMSLFISIVAYLILIPTISSVINTRYIFCIYPFILLFWFIILGFLTELIWINGKKYLLIMVCISCIITYSEYKRGYVDFLYQGYEDMADTISEYSDLDVLYVEEYLFPIYRDMMFLDRSERFIPIEYDKFEESLNNIYTEKNEDGVIVYVFRDLDEQKVFDVLEKEWGYTEFTHLALTYQSNVYLCR
jgi:hypothetical protein